MVKHWLLILGLLFAGDLYAAPEKIVYHLNTDRPDVQWKTITNLENLYLGIPDQELDIKILLQGQGIDLLNKVNSNRDLGVRLAELIDLGLEIEVSRKNYYRHRHEINLENPPNLISNVFIRLIELQDKGYHYITP